MGLALLLWTLVGTVNKIEDSLNFVWRVQRGRSMPRRVIEFAVLVTVGPLVVATVIAFSKLAFDSVASYTRRLHPRRQGHAAADPARALRHRDRPVHGHVPADTQHARARAAGAGGSVWSPASLWAATGKAFTAMVIYTSRLTLVYAGFAVVIAVFLWTYLGWLILLAGAQLAFYLQNPNYLRLGHADFDLSSNEEERLALDIMARVAMEHRAGHPPWTLEKLSRALALPGIAIASMAEHLERAGLLAQADDGKLFPGREISSITLAEVIHTRPHAPHRP